MVLDYSTACAACSTPLSSPPRDGADSMCALLHTEQGRAELTRLRENRERKQSNVNKAPVNTDPVNNGGDLLTDVNNQASAVNTRHTHDRSLTTEADVIAGGESSGKSETRAEYMREYMRRRRAE